MMTAELIDPVARCEHERWLLELTAIPTAAGREQRVVAWIRAWCDARDDLAMEEDPAGNLTILRKASAGQDSDEAPLYITAHLDHPAFVVEEVEGETVRASFRGGVLDAYFANRPRVRFFPDGGLAVAAEVVASEKGEPFRTAELRIVDGGSVARGDIGRWDLPEPEVVDGILHTHACDDLAALAAALAALDVLRGDPAAAHVRLLLTRAEEIGFIGAIAACRGGGIHPSSRLVLLENSRSFADSPIGAGPIVRVGDRISTFSPTLTAALAKLADGLDKARAGTDAPFRWQRKLMPGGACEASAYQAYGYEAACLCLPLGNYHNMADLDGVQSGDAGAVASAAVGREHVSMDDFRHLVDLLVAAGRHMGSVESVKERMEELFAKKAFILNGG